MAAQLVDAIMGYEYFLEKRGETSRDDVNNYLIQKSRIPISQRTYDHYRKLLKMGFPAYIPINQFDVSRTIGQLQMFADRRRYPRDESHINAMVSLDGKKWIKANVIDRSIVGFGMKTNIQLSIKSKRLIWVRIEQYRDIPAILIWKKSKENQTRFGVRAIEFISRYYIAEAKIIVDSRMGQLIIRKSSKGDISWEELYRVMSKVNELIDSSKVLLDSIAEMANRDIKFTPTILSCIKFSSPGEFILNLDYKLILIIYILIKTFQLWKPRIERYHEVTRSIKLENDKREIEVIVARKAMKSRKEASDLDITRQLSEELPSPIKKALNINQLPSGIFKPGSFETGILSERVVPAVAELISGDDPDIEVEVNKCSPNDQGNDS